MNQKEKELRLLYDQHAKLVYNLSLHYLRNREDAEEATQDVFVKVFQNLDSFRNNSEIKTWIYRITINQCLDLIRSRTRKKRFGFLTSLFTDEQPEGHLLINTNHPGAILESKEKLAQLFSAIDLLPDTQKTSLILLKIEGLSTKEAAEIMKTTEKAVESTFQRAKQNLKKNLKGSEGFWL